MAQWLQAAVTTDAGCRTAALGAAAAVLGEARG